VLVATHSRQQLRHMQYGTQHSALSTQLPQHSALQYSTVQCNTSTLLIVMLMLPVLLLHTMGLDSVEGASRASYIVSTSIYNRAAQVTILSSQQYYELQADALSTFRAR
jgi:hypothetical protein